MIGNSTDFDFGGTGADYVTDMIGTTMFFFFFLFFFCAAPAGWVQHRGPLEAIEPDV